MLAAKVALAARFDAFGESETISMDLGTNHLANLEYKLRLMEEGSMTRISGTAKAKAKFEKYQVKREIVQYSAAADSTIPSNKRKIEDSDIKQEYVEKATLKEVKQEQEVEQPPKKKKKKNKGQENGSGDTSINNVADISVKSEQHSVLSEGQTPKSKKKKRDIKEETTEEQTYVENENSPKKKKKKKNNDSVIDDTSINESVVESGKKKKKNKNQTEVTETVTEAALVEVDSEKKKKKKKKKSLNLE